MNQRFICACEIGPVTGLLNLQVYLLEIGLVRKRLKRGTGSPALQIVTVKTHLVVGVVVLIGGVHSNAIAVKALAVSEGVAAAQHNRITKNQNIDLRTDSLKAKTAQTRADQRRG